MATSFPSGLDALAKPGATDEMDDVGFYHDELHTNVADAIEAIEAKIGVNGSAVTASLDFRVAQLEEDVLSMALLFGGG